MYTHICKHVVVMDMYSNTNPVSQQIIRNPNSYCIILECELNKPNTFISQLIAILISNLPLLDTTQQCNTQL